MFGTLVSGKELLYPVVLVRQISGVPPFEVRTTVVSGGEKTYRQNSIRSQNRLSAWSLLDVTARMEVVRPRRVTRQVSRFGQLDISTEMRSVGKLDINVPSMSAADNPSAGWPRVRAEGIWGRLGFSRQVHPGKPIEVTRGGVTFQISTRCVSAEDLRQYL